MEKFKFKIEGTEIDDLLRITRGEEKEEKKPVKVNTVKCTFCGTDIEKTSFKADDFVFLNSSGDQIKSQSYIAPCHNCSYNVAIHKSLIKEEDNE